MLLQALGPDDDVVQIHVTYLPNEMLERTRHAALMDGRCITNTHWHDCPFVKTPRSVNSQPVDVIGVDLRLKERISHIYFSKELAFCAITQDFVNPEQWMVIWDGV